jgi:hypothetical protein
MFKGPIPAGFAFQRSVLHGLADHSPRSVVPPWLLSLCLVPERIGYPSTSGTRRGRGCCTGICTVTAARSSNAEPD